MGSAESDSWIIEPSSHSQVPQLIIFFIFDLFGRPKRPEITLEQRFDSGHMDTSS